MEFLFLVKRPDLTSINKKKSWFSHASRPQSKMK